MRPAHEKAGGEIVAQGTPENIVKVKRIYTGEFFLRPVLGHDRRPKKHIEAAE
jgi:excinuclease ABC subunit A